jgi:hypothetical protein
VVCAASVAAQKKTASLLQGFTSPSFNLSGDILT